MMRYATIQGEKTVSDLVNRLYQLPGAGRLNTALTRTPEEIEALVKKAEDVLRRANPFLDNFSTIPPKTVIVVPLVEGLNHTSAAIAPGAAIPTAIADIRTAVTADLAVLDASAKSQLNELTAFQEALSGGDSDWKQLINTFEDLKNTLPIIRADTDQSIQSLKELLDLRNHVTKQMEDDLKEFSQVL